MGGYMSRSRRGRATISTILLAVLLLGVMPVTPASAWKMKTHAYSANLILDEIAASNGMLEIKGYGRFPVKPDYLAAIQAYPRSYRAGTLGPDGYPDMYIGQAFIHPGPTFVTGSMGVKKIDGTYTDEWLQQQWDFVQNLPANDPDKQQALAFLLGWLTHSAGDVFGHDYINQLSGGVFPAISEAAQDTAKMRIIARHNITEAYIDSKIPAQYNDERNDATYNKYLKLDAPTRYIYNYMLKDGNNIRGGDKPWAADLENPLFSRFSSQHPEPFQWLRETREQATALADLNFWTNPVREPFGHAWRADIDWAAERWVERNATVAQKLLVGDFTTAKTELIHWAWHDGASAAGAPDAVLDTFAVLGNVFGSVAGWVSDLLYPALRDRIKEWVQTNIFSKLTEKAFNMTWAEVESMKDPEPYLDNRYLFRRVALFSAGIRGRMDAYMDNYGQVLSNSNDSTFVPFYNTMVMTKLILIGPAGDNALLAAAGSPTRITNQNIMLGWVKSLDGSMSWEDGRQTVGMLRYPSPLARFTYRGAYGPTLHSPIYDDRNVWCSLFKGYGTGVLNPSFDERNANGLPMWKADGLPMEWRSWGAGSVNRVAGFRRAEESEAKDVLRIENKSRDTASGFGVWTPFVAKAGETYQLSAWAAAGADAGRAVLAIEYLDAAGNRLPGKGMTGAQLGLSGDALKKVDFSCAAPAGTVVGRVATAVNGGSSDVWAAFDDVVITGVDVVVAPPVNTEPGLGAPVAPPVKSKPSLGAPVTPKTMRRVKYYTVYGALYPRHTSGTKPVRIYKYRKVSGRWKPYGYVTAKAYDYKGYTRYKVNMRLTKAGSWRVRAYAPADSGHLATWSGKYTYVKVR